MYSDLKQKVEEAFNNGGADPNCCYPTYMYTDIMKVIDEYELKMKGAIEWCAEDMIGTAKNQGWILSEEDAQTALEDMIDHHDCNNGITWTTVEYYINQYNKLEEEK